jgi:hypothetical protein
VTNTTKPSGGTAEAYDKTIFEQREVRHIMAELDGCTEADARAILRRSAR